MSLQPAATLSHVSEAAKPEATERILTVVSPTSVTAAQQPNYVKINVRYPSTVKKSVVNRHSSNYMKINEDLDTPHGGSSIRETIKNVSQINEAFTAKKKSTGQEETLSELPTPHVES